MTAQIDDDNRVSLLIISPCRDEANYMRKTLDSVVNQTLKPEKWLIVNDGSTDKSADILQEYSKAHSWIEVVEKPNRGERSVGPGVIETFYFGYDHINTNKFEYICKLDLDLDLPPKYFETLLKKMADNVKLGTCSGKPYIRTNSGRLKAEGIGDDISAGMTKLYRKACFDDIGGFVREVMWDGIDCHTARMKGWAAFSYDEPELRFEHLRIMGSSHAGILTGRARHGFGQYFMGSDPFYFFATCIYRLKYEPYVLGAFAMFIGYLKAFLNHAKRYENPKFRRFLRRYQRSVLLHGKARAIQQLEREAT